ncbi:MAG: alcohol dehydrogenase catalytic domain-containing protein [Chloroflexi bacterium]|nr:alcohol dehydrogenase catalytic domain-containing protein [Chloroflexota bacterium]
MRAMVFDGALRLAADYPRPSPGHNEASIRVGLAGICNTDLEIVKGYMGFKGVLGHEFVGVVEECRDPDLVGQRVVGEINVGCGACPYCSRGLSRHCPDRSVLGILGRDGALAEYVTLPIENLHPVPKSLPDEEAVFAEPLAAALEIREQVNISPSDSVLVLGDGKLGLLVAQVLAPLSRKLRVVGKHRSSLAILSQRGIETCLAGDSPPERADIVVDCTGSPSGLEAAMRLTKPKGTIVLKSTVATGASLNLAPLVVDEITVVGSRCGPFRPALDALDKKTVGVRPLIAGIYPISDGLRAFEHAAQHGTLKVLISFHANLTQ